MKEKKLFGHNLWSIWIMWEPRDMWVGVFWRTKDHPQWRQRITDIYLCLIPCIPIRLSVGKIISRKFSTEMEKAMGHSYGCGFLMYDQGPCDCA